MIDVMNLKKKPCPWCGSTEYLRMDTVGSYLGDMPARPYRIRCTHIDHDTVQGPVGYGRYGAWQAWNNRHVGEVNEQ